MTDRTVMLGAFKNFARTKINTIALPSLGAGVSSRAFEIHPSDKNNQTIYVMRFDNGVVKVGRTKNPSSRLASYVYNNPLNKFKYLCFDFHDETSEKLVYEHFGQFCIKGREWFKLPEPILNNFLEMNGVDMSTADSVEYNWHRPAPSPDEFWRYVLGESDTTDARGATETA